MSTRPFVPPTQGLRHRKSRKHASAPISARLLRQVSIVRGFCTSTGVDYGRRTMNASDGSVGRYYDPATGQFLNVDPLRG